MEERAEDLEPGITSEGTSEESRHQHKEVKPWYSGGLKDWIFTTDHKKIGILYFFTSFIFFLLAGMMGMLIRYELTNPGIQLPSIAGQEGADLYNYLLTGHGTLMLLWWAVAVWTGAFGNFLIPLMIGAKDVAFPRLNAFSYWVFLGASVMVLLTAIPGNWIKMLWTAYPPFASNPNAGPVAYYSIIILLYGIAATAGSVNFVATIISMRTKGLSFRKMNLFTHTILGANLIQLFGVPSFLGAVTLLFLDRYIGTNFFNPEIGGDPLLYQNIFWFYSHPAVYVMILPAFGIYSEVIATMSRKPIFGYVSMVLAIYLIALIGFLVWAHHMFAAGIPDWARVLFSYTTILVGVPTGIKIFNWLATMYKGAIRLTAPMLFVLGGLFMFLIGGLTGVLLSMVSANLGLTDSMFVVGHFHYVLGMSVTFAALAGILYWFPKVTGKMYNEKLGVWSFIFAFIGSNIFYFFQTFSGTLGISRRYADYPNILEWVLINQIQTFGSVLLFVGIVLFLINIIVSLRSGQKAPKNPWHSPSLEWSATDTPVMSNNFKKDHIEIHKDWHPYAYYKGYHEHF
ncbi:MAG: cbb3-type cytochrome c oxidase subunit I [Spirochaetes bacterium]|nr:cbb3-type cytochrome c oxidase subunit I [Spirochaetota bacterium]